MLCDPRTRTWFRINSIGNVRGSWIRLISLIIFPHNAVRTESVDLLNPSNSFNCFSWNFRQISMLFVIWRRNSTRKSCAWLLTLLIFFSSKNLNFLICAVRRASCSQTGFFFYLNTRPFSRLVVVTSCARVLRVGLGARENAVIVSRQTANAGGVFRFLLPTSSLLSLPSFAS